MQAEVLPERLMSDADSPCVWLVQADPERRRQWAAGLRQDGMAVREFDRIGNALTALRQSPTVAMLVTQANDEPLAVLELISQARTAAPRLEIVFTQQAGSDGASCPPGLAVLTEPFDGAKLSRHIRLVAAKPALRSALQRRFREARQTVRIPVTS
jgi:DNA-binding NtrC family response regulator